MTENKLEMKKYLLLLVSLFVLVACGPKLEKEIEESYPDGSPRLVVYYKTVDGFRDKVKVEAFYENGQQRYQGEFKDDKRNGYWLYWYENGNKWSEGYFKDDVRDGYGTTWYENGSKHFEGSYLEGVRVGVWKFYTQEGQLAKENDYDKKEKGRHRQAKTYTSSAY